VNAGGRAVNELDKEAADRGRAIAKNEAERQITGDIRVSSWTIVFAIIIGVIAVAIVWGWVRG